jgi:hypothetical protein
LGNTKVDQVVFHLPNNGATPQLIKPISDPQMFGGTNLALFLLPLIGEIALLILHGSFTVPSAKLT